MCSAREANSQVGLYNDTVNMSGTGEWGWGWVEGGGGGLVGAVS